jgi:hypothetical protein
LLDVSDARLAADHFIALTFGVAHSRLGSANAGRGVRIRPLMRAFKVYVHPDAGRIELTCQAFGVHDELIGAHTARALVTALWTVSPRARLPGLRAAGSGLARAGAPRTQRPDA